MRGDSDMLPCVMERGLMLPRRWIGGNGILEDARVGEAEPGNEELSARCGRGIARRRPAKINLDRRLGKHQVLSVPLSRRSQGNGDEALEAGIGGREEADLGGFLGMGKGQWFGADEAG